MDLKQRAKSMTAGNVSGWMFVLGALLVQGCLAESLEEDSWDDSYLIEGADGTLDSGEWDEPEEVDEWLMDKGAPGGSTSGQPNPSGCGGGDVDPTILTEDCPECPPDDPCGFSHPTPFTLTYW